MLKTLKLSISILLLLRVGMGLGRSQPEATFHAFYEFRYCILATTENKSVKNPLSTVLATPCWSSAAHPKPAHTPPEAERKNSGTGGDFLNEEL